MEGKQVVLRSSTVSLLVAATDRGNLPAFNLSSEARFISVPTVDTPSSCVASVTPPPPPPLLPTLLAIFHHTSWTSCVSRTPCGTHTYILVVHICTVVEGAPFFFWERDYLSRSSIRRHQKTDVGEKERFYPDEQSHDCL